LGVSYAVTIAPNIPQDTQLTGQAFVRARGPLISVPNYSATLNCIANPVTLVVSPIRVGMDLTLAADPAKACSLNLINYTAKVVNSGEFLIDHAVLRVVPGTFPVDGNP